MTIKLIRKYNKNYTLGKLEIQSHRIVLKTLELPYKDNQKSISCIPTGAYKIRLYNSQKFNDCIKIFSEDGKSEVKGRSDILIHSGNSVANFTEDKGTKWKCESEGCILIGCDSEAIVDTKFREQCLIFESRKGLEILIKYLKDECNGESELIVES